MGSPSWATDWLPSNTQEMTYQLQTLPSRDLTNIRLGLKTHTWSAVLFVDNVFNWQVPMEYLNLIALTAPLQQNRYQSAADCRLGSQL